MPSDLATNEVTALYESVLFRQPDSDGLAGWANELDSGQITLTGLITAFVDSPEAQNLVDPIIELYDGLYGRAPDIPGLQYWVSQADAGMSMSTIAQYFVTSQEFYADYGTNTLSNPTAFVEALYENFLGRAADPSGLATWVAALGAIPTVASEAAVVLDFVNSAEFQHDLSNDVSLWLTNAANWATSGSTATLIGTGSYGSTIIPGEMGGVVTVADTGGSETVNLTSTDGFTGTNDLAGLPVVVPLTAGSTEAVDLQGMVTGATSSGNYTSTIITGANDTGVSLTLEFNNAPTEAWAGGTEANSQVNVTSATSLANALDIAASQAVVLDGTVSQELQLLTSGSTGGLVDWFQYGGNMYLIENATGAHTTTVTSNGQTTLELNGSTGLVDWFQYGGNTYLVEAVNNTTSAAVHTALGTHDVVVELVGIVDPSHISMTFA